MSHAGIHHVTAISGPARRTLDFYRDRLGLRLVKKTVNFDDPGTWHLYFGDETGSPGSILTYFPWANARAGRLGTGETTETALAIPAASLGWWTQRLVAAGIPHDNPERRFGETVLGFRDPDGMRLSLVGVTGEVPSSPNLPIEGGNAPPFLGGSGDVLSPEGSGVPAEHAIRGIHGVTLTVTDGAPTGQVLAGVLGFEADGAEGLVTRYRAHGTAIGGIVDLRSAGGFPRGALGRGTVHHVAFRAGGDDEQAEMVGRLKADLGIATTEQKDRNYFRSVYFREPGGVLFEIATDDPGFAVDEPASELGSALQLPAFLEPRRSDIARALPELD